MTTRAAREQTAGQTPGLTLYSVSPTANCAWCRAPMAHPRRNQRFCTPKCRTADNMAKWGSAPGAVLDWLVGLMLRGVITRTPTLWQLELALEAAGAKRWSRLMDMIGLQWDSEGRRWTRNG